MVTTTKATAQKLLGDVPEEKRFWCHDGTALKNLADLEKAFKKMSEETYRYHSNQAKNDFSKWVGEVVGDGELAKDLEKSSTSAQAAKIASSKVSQLTKQASSK